MVYRALQLNVDRPVAIKVLNAELSRAGSTGVARFEREARTIARLTHPHVLRLIDFGRTEHGQMYIVTELIQGEPLSKILERGHLSSRRTTKILHQSCAAMEDFHGAGIVHRDLKPANLIVDQVNGDDFVRVLDFGIARDDAVPALTMSNMLVGTPAYMSPEQSRGESATVSSDLYSLGIIAYECLSGRPPFFGDAPLGILLKQVSEAPPPLTGAATPPELIRLVMELLEKLPAGRPASPAEVRRRLERIEEAHPPTGETAPFPQALYLSAPTPRPAPGPSSGSSLHVTPSMFVSPPSLVLLDPSIALKGNGQPPRAILIFECARRLSARGTTRDQVDAMTRGRSATPTWVCPPDEAKEPVLAPVASAVVEAPIAVAESEPRRSALPIVGWLIAGAGAAVGGIAGTAFLVSAGSAQSDFDALLADLTARSNEQQNITGELPRLGALDQSAREGRQSSAAAFAIGGSVLAVGLFLVVFDAVTSDDVASAPVATPGTWAFHF